MFLSLRQPAMFVLVLTPGAQLLGQHTCCICLLVRERFCAFAGLQFITSQMCAAVQCDYRTAVVVLKHKVVWLL